MSPYITECPYCGTRLRKRAPKIDRNGRIAERIGRRSPAPSLPRLRRGEIPGIRHEAHPYATGLIVLLSIAGTLLWRTSLVSPFNLMVAGNPDHQWWRALTASFVYDNTGYAVITLLCIALFGWLLERRHGAVLVIALTLVGGAGGLIVAGHTTDSVVMGGNGAALALLCAWAVPDLTALIQKREYEADLLGAAVLAATVVLMPLAAPSASWAAAGVGVLAGLVFGFLLTRIHH